MKLTVTFDLDQLEGPELAPDVVAFEALEQLLNGRTVVYGHPAEFVCRYDVMDAAVVDVSN